MSQEPAVSPQKVVHKHFRCVSLFSGFGGFDLGMERAGFVIDWQVEIDPYCRKVLERHWPTVRRWDDVSTFQPGPHFGTDVVFGGDPCQANSAAGRSTAKSFGGEFLRVVEAVRPRVVLRENPSHIRADAPWPWWRFRAGLESLGYACVPFRLRACCAGGDHRRERLFVLGVMADANGVQLARRDNEGSPAGEPRDDFPSLVGPEVWPDVPKHRGHGSRNGLPRYVERVRGIGNAVCPQVAEWIGRRLISVL